MHLDDAHGQLVTIFRSSKVLNYVNRYCIQWTIQWSKVNGHVHRMVSREVIGLSMKFIAKGKCGRDHVGGGAEQSN